MAAIVTALLAGIGAVWTFVTDTFVPADAASVNLVHLGLWGGLITSMMFSLLNLVRRGGRR
jgi:hypothetical protein